MPFTELGENVVGAICPEQFQVIFPKSCAIPESVPLITPRIFKFEFEFQVAIGIIPALATNSKLPPVRKFKLNAEDNTVEAVMLDLLIVPLTLVLLFALLNVALLPIFKVPFITKISVVPPAVKTREITAVFPVRLSVLPTSIILLIPLAQVKLCATPVELILTVALFVIFMADTVTAPVCITLLEVLKTTRCTAVGTPKLQLVAVDQFASPPPPVHVLSSAIPLNDVNKSKKNNKKRKENFFSK